MTNWLRKHRLNIFLFILLIIGLLIRIFFVDKIAVGDLMNYSEWGQRLYDYGPKNLYFSDGWYYSVPVYPPVSMWMFAGLHFINEHRYLLAESHNLFRFPPSTFIVYFYNWGQIFLLKLPAILSDLALSVLVYSLVYKLTNNIKRSFIAFCFFLFNPIPIFISGFWGQTDSIVAILGLMAFVTLLNRNIMLSAPLIFLSIYFKPSWAILVPFYLFLIIYIKPKFTEILIASLTVVTLFILTTQPFANENVFLYGWKIYKLRYPIPIGFDGKASISAFNFQTIFWRMDVDLASNHLLGVKSSLVGAILFLIANIFAFLSFAKQKNKLYGMLSGIFIIGMSSFLFMQTMLERYFFPAFVPMIILTFSKPKLLLNLIVINIILFTNLIYSFYRRGNDLIYHLFIDNNFLLMRVLSIVQVLMFATFIRPLVLQFKRGK